MPQLDAVLFDLDGTLVRYRRSPGELLAASFQANELDPLFTVDEYRERFDAFASEYDTMETLRSECFATLAQENGYEAAAGRAVASTFHERRDQSAVELVPGAERILARLGEAVQLGIVTNGTADAQHAKIAAVDLASMVDVVVVAGHKLPPKPDPAPFERALEKLECEPDAAIHVGDSINTDIQGARAAGMDAVWVSEDGTTEMDAELYRVDSLESILPLLRDAFAL